VRVRFAPSPTGNLHVGGARTALFNWLLARQLGGKFVLRVEDTDQARSTKESEEAVLRDLKWLGLDWDEGPDVGGDYGPYRQTERADIYKEYVDRLVSEGKAYPCFCTDEELEKMRAEAEANKLPPIYRGPWATASKEEVDAKLAEGAPCTYRFRVPKDETVTISDLVRGDVSWSTNTLGDFIILRSNGLPVYNFCVAADDATMGITHVLRAEEHLPNTLRQALIYDALGFAQPVFGHVSLILAPDRSKLSKRHGATSVGQFAEMGYLPEAMVNFLAALGWNDGTEKEVYTVQELIEGFGVDRVTKSAAVFDNAKLNWMNGEHLKLKPDAERLALMGERWAEAGLLTADAATGPVGEACVPLVESGMELVADCVPELASILAYPLEETCASDKAKAFVEDGLGDVARYVVAAHESGELGKAIEESTMKAWIKAAGKEMDRKGKRLFMPLRIVLTGSMQGPDVAQQVAMISLAEKEGAVAEGADFKGVGARMEAVKAWAETQPVHEAVAAA